MLNRSEFKDLLQAIHTSSDLPRLKRLSSESASNVALDSGELIGVNKTVVPMYGKDLQTSQRSPYSPWISVAYLAERKFISNASEINQ